MFISKLETRNFDFMVVHDYEEDGRSLIAEAWEIHRLQTNAFAEFDEYADDVVTTEISPNIVYRDGEPLSDWGAGYYDKVLAGGSPVITDHGGYEAQGGWTKSEKWADVPGRVRLADGSEHPAIITLCLTDSCEHYGTAIRVRGRWAVQGERGFTETLGRPTRDIFPYRYQYSPIDGFEDIHIDPATGWSL